MNAPDIAVADTFEQACDRLQPGEAKRADTFVNKLTADPSRAGAHFEFVRKQPDRCMRSARVSLDLRAIAYQCGDTLTLLWVDHHDAAYRWARTKCIVCQPITGRVVSITDVPDSA